MPVIKSVKKSLRSSRRKEKENKKKKKDLKEILKDFKKLLESEKDKAKEKLPLVYKKLDKAAKTNLIKKNKANRLKSRLTKKAL